MSITKCPECKKEVSSKADVCQNCGYSLKDARNRKKNFIYVMTILFGVAFIAATCKNNTPPTTNTSIQIPPPKIDIAAGLDTSRQSTVLKRISTKVDKVENIYWRKHQNSPKYNNSRSTLYLYFGGTEKEASNLRMVFTYTAEDWLFINGYTIKTDNNSYTLTPPSHFSVERDNAGGSIWEWYDVPVTQEYLPMLKDIANSKEVIIRYDGRQYHNDKTLSQADKTAIKEIIIAFSKMNGTL